MYKQSNVFCFRKFNKNREINKILRRINNIILWKYNEEIFHDETSRYVTKTIPFHMKGTNTITGVEWWEVEIVKKRF